jgi:hypothetical protein
MVILVCGPIDDEQIVLLVEALNRNGADFLVLDERTLSDQVLLRWQFTDGGLTGQVKVNTRVVCVEEISAVYHRFLNPEDIFPTGESPQRICKTRSVLRALMDLFDIISARMVNRRRNMMSNNSKPYQSLLIQKAGFMIPETLITNNGSALETFARKHDSLIFKSISSARSIVAPLDEKMQKNLCNLQYLPTQFQRRIEGLNVRVHVVGRRAFATQALTNAVDYRFASLEDDETRLKPYELTFELRNRSVYLARKCGLAFAGIDLIISKDGVYCLEVNPSPGFSYYEEATGQRISYALASYLSRS